VIVSDGFQECLLCLDSPNEIEGGKRVEDEVQDIYEEVTPHEIVELSHRAQKLKFSRQFNSEDGNCSDRAAKEIRGSIE